MPGVGPAHQAQALRRIEQPVDAAVAELPGARRVELDARRGAVQAVEHAAMRHQGQQFARVALRQRRHAGHAALVELGQPLAALGAEAGVALAPAFAGLGMIALDLGPGQALEDAEGALAQAALGPRHEARGPGQRLGGLPGALQVARVERRDALVGQRRGDARRLPAALVVERHVELALDARVDVPGRLAVADGEDAGDGAVRHARA